MALVPISFRFQIAASPDAEKMGNLVNTLEAIRDFVSFGTNVAATFCIGIRAWLVDAEVVHLPHTDHFAHLGVSEKCTEATSGHSAGPELLALSR